MAISIVNDDILNLLQYIIFPGCIILASCEQEKPFVLLKSQDSTFAFVARINPSPSPFTSSKAKVRGQLTIVNRTPVAQEFGDRFLFLETADGIARRTYLDDVESYVIDFSTVTIKGSDSLAIQVYWVFKRAEKLSYQNLTFDRSALEQYLHNKRH